MPVACPCDRRLDIEIAVSGSLRPLPPGLVIIYGKKLEKISPFSVTRFVIIYGAASRRTPGSF
jgi:hypothetical protein